MSVWYVSLLSMRCVAAAAAEDGLNIRPSYLMRQSFPREASRVAILENEADIILIGCGLWLDKVMEVRSHFDVVCVAGDYRCCWWWWW